MKVRFGALRKFTAPQQKPIKVDFRNLQNPRTIVVCKFSLGEHPNSSLPLSKNQSKWTFGASKILVQSSFASSLLESTQTTHCPSAKTNQSGLSEHPKFSYSRRLQVLSWRAPKQFTAPQQKPIKVDFRIISHLRVYILSTPGKVTATQQQQTPSLAASPHRLSTLKGGGFIFPGNLRPLSQA